MNPSNQVKVSDDDDVYRQTYQEVECSRDLLPVLQDNLIRIDRLISKTQLIAHKLGVSKLLIQHSYKLLSSSKDDIYRLDKETCHTLLRTIKELVTHLRSKISESENGEQPWPDSRIHLKDLSHSTNPCKEVFMNDWYDRLYMELKYIRELYFPVLHEEHWHLKGLILKDQVSANKLESLKFFLEKSMNLLALNRASIALADKKECCRLVQMTKLFVVGALMKGFAHRDVKQVWPLENLCAISELLQQMNMKSKSDQVGTVLKFEAVSSDYPCQPPRGGLSEGDDWHHQAYEELLSIRMLSSQLDQAYNNVYREHLCDWLTRASDKFLQKSLEFLATSKAEMVSLSKEKFYHRMMLIKFFMVLTTDSVSANQNALQQVASGSLPQISETRLESHQVYHGETGNSTRHNQLESSRNWRDVIYEELRDIRKKYSSELDEAYRMQRGVRPKNPELVKKRKACSNIYLGDFLAFLGYSRADLALMSKEECLHRLMRIRNYLNCPKKFVSAEQYEEFLKLRSRSTNQNQPERLPYWRDEVYKEIKFKRTKFLHVDDQCKEVHNLSSQFPELATVLNQLDPSRARARYLFTMNRAEIALLSKEAYDHLVVLVNQELVKVGEILTHLPPTSTGRRIGFPCDISGIMLEQRKTLEIVTHSADGCN